MQIVSDTGPLHYLVLLEQDFLLGVMFDNVVIPSVVRAEMNDAEAPAHVRAWIASPPSWLSILNAPVAETPTLPKTLGRGERATIALAIESRPDLVLMDDRAAVLVAREHGLSVTGTLGLLYRAAKRGLTDLPTTLDRLKATNFHYTQALLDSVLERFNAG